MWKGPSFTPFDDTYDVLYSHCDPAGGATVLYCTLVPPPRRNVPVCLNVNPSLPVDSPNLFCTPERNGNIKLILSHFIPNMFKQGNWFGTAASKLEIWKLLNAIQTRKKGKSFPQVKRNAGNLLHAPLATKKPKLSFELKGISPFRRKMNVLESQSTAVSTTDSNQQQQSQPPAPVQQKPLDKSSTSNQFQLKAVPSPAVGLQRTIGRQADSGLNQHQQIQTPSPVQQQSLQEIPSSGRKVLQESHLPAGSCRPVEPGANKQQILPPTPGLQKVPSSGRKVLQKSDIPAGSGRPVEPGANEQQILPPTPVLQEVPSSGRFLQKFLLTPDPAQPTAVQRPLAVPPVPYASNFLNPVTSNSSTLLNPMLRKLTAPNQTEVTAVHKLPVIATMPSPVPNLVLPEPVPCTDFSIPPPPHPPPGLPSRQFQFSGSIPTVPVSKQNLQGPDPSLTLFEPIFRPNTANNGAALIQLTGSGKAAVNTKALLPSPRPATYCQTCTFDSLQAANTAFTGKMV